MATAVSQRGAGIEGIDNHYTAAIALSAKSNDKNRLHQYHSAMRYNGI
jgi:hypothetical protein